MSTEHTPDLLPTESPGPHIQGDVRPLLLERWDLVIAHPPCTYLCNSGGAMVERVDPNEAMDGLHMEIDDARAAIAKATAN